MFCNHEKFNLFSVAYCLKHCKKYNSLQHLTTVCWGCNILSRFKLGAHCGIVVMRRFCKPYLADSNPVAHKRVLPSHFSRHGGSNRSVGVISTVLFLAIKKTT